MSKKIKGKPDFKINIPQKIGREMSESLYSKIIKIVVHDKKYKDPDYSAKKLTVDIQTNSRYLSAIFRSCMGMNYNQFVNQYRIRDAQEMLADPDYDDYTAEEIGLMVGFSNRQCFYLAFDKIVGKTPRKYRIEQKNE